MCGVPPSPGLWRTGKDACGVGARTANEYAMEDLVEVFQRYVPRSEYESFKAELKERAEAQREVENQTEPGRTSSVSP